MLQLLTGQGATGGSEVTASKQMQNEESKVGGTAEQTQAQKVKTKSADRNVIKSNEVIFVQGGMYSSEEKDRPLLKSGKVMEA